MNGYFEVNTCTRRYSVHIGPGILSKVGSLIPEGVERIFIITDDVVSNLHLSPLLSSLADSGIEPMAHTLRAGEETKTLDTACMLLDSLIEERVSRSDLVLALGGGVIGDLSGFVASILKRGVGLAQVPTTLLAQVDSALGGKTGVNHHLGKNLIGTFYQPHLILADVSTLKTLSGIDYVDGLAEVVKYAAILDSTLMDFLLDQRNEILQRTPEILAQIVERCLRLKAMIVETDEREESGQREVLNFGHTVGHAIETYTQHEVSHGRAVAVGMVEEAHMAMKMGLLNEQSFGMLVSTLRAFGLPTEVPAGIDRDELASIMQQDKKVRRGQLILPVLVELGRTELRAIDSVY